MDFSPGSSFRCKLFPRLVWSTFLAALFAYVWLIIRPHLIYDAFGIYLPFPEFSLDWTCLRTAWSRPAGPVRYVSAFLSHWFYYSYAGALIITTVAALIGWATDKLIRRDGDWRFLSLLPACAVLALYRTYHHPLPALVALATCLWFAVGFETIARRSAPLTRAVVFLGLCFGLYYLVGTVSLLFGLLIGTWCAGGERRVFQAGIAILASAVVPWLIGAGCFHMTVAEAYSLAWPFGPDSASDLDALPNAVLRGLFLFPLFCLWLVAAGRRLWRAIRTRWTTAAGPPRAGFLGLTCGGSRVLCRLAAGAILALSLAAMHYLCRSPHRAIRFEIVHSTRDREWEQVLEAGRQLGQGGYDPFCNHLVNRALYHTGRLGDDMFSFAQRRAGLLLLTADVPKVPPKYWMLSETALEIGDINFAERWGFDTLESVGDSPSMLERLALICTAKQRDEAARVLLERLHKDLIFGRRADRLRELAEQRTPPDNEWGRQVERLRAIKCADDYAFHEYSEEFMLQNLLQANRHNRMAFEYLMAFYLLERRTDKLVENLPRLDDLGFQEIPRHYEEAMLIHASITGQTGFLGERNIRPETVARFREFVRRYSSGQNPRLLDVAGLERDFGGSYLPYYAFGVSAGVAAR